MSPLETRNSENRKDGILDLEGILSKKGGIPLKTELFTSNKIFS
jgi:hypothetical protein